jgi:hypothetical protein
VLGHLVDAVAAIFRETVAAVAIAAGLAAATPPLVDAACDGRLVLRSGGALRAAELDEVSGIVESRRRAGVFWIHNDSGGGARLYAVGLDGRRLATFGLAGVEARDWEDIAAGPGPVAGGRYLYVGDIGDNARRRRTISVLRLREPAVDPAAAPAAGTIRDVDELVLRYPDRAHDAEALLVDPRSGDLLVVTKEVDGRAAVFRASGRLAAGSETVLRRVATLSLGLATLVTGGDVSRSGAVVALRTYGSVLLYLRPAGRPVWAAFRRRPCRGLAPPETQGEAIALRTGGRSYVTVGEGVRPPVHRVGTRRLPTRATPRTTPTRR